jgi:enoyl-CoA hydratase
MSDLVRVDREERLALVTVDRAEKRNALNLGLVQDLHRVVDELARDADLGAVVVTGAGDHFMAGADIAELRERGRAEGLASINGSLFRKIEELPVPVIAAVKGYALGGGCELALACDLRVAGHSAVFGQPEAGLGILPGAGATYRLPRLVGFGRARDLIYTGRRVPAEEAYAMGLVERLVADADVLGTARDVAGRILKQDPLAVRTAKLALAAQHQGTEAGRTVERLAQGMLFESEEKERRMKAFLDRRRD